MAKDLHPHNEEAQKAWMDTHCHDLKHEVRDASRLLTVIQTIEPKRVSQSSLQGLQEAITYFRNHHHQMLYAEVLSSNLLIDSVITESAYQVIIKARLGCSGMKWKDWRASVVLSLRTLIYTKGRWQQLWSKINRYCFSL